MRDKRWRIWRGSLILKKRIKRHFCFRSSYFPFYNDASVKTWGTNWTDFISSSEVIKFRSITTDKWDTRWKTKFSPNKSNNYWRDIRGKNKTTREKEKINFTKIKKEYGI